MFGLGPAELLIIGVFALLFIGPKKLPELARGLGRSLREFQRAKDDFQHEIDREVNEVKEVTKSPLAEPLAKSAEDNTKQEELEKKSE